MKLICVELVFRDIRDEEQTISKQCLRIIVN